MSKTIDQERYLPSGAESQTLSSSFTVSDQPMSDLRTPEFPGDIDGIFENGFFETQESYSLDSPLLFEEPVKDLDAQIVPSSTNGALLSPYREDYDDCSWLQTIIGPSKRSDNEVQPPYNPTDNTSDYHNPAPRALNDYTSLLVEYYFKEVCGMMSCYDSQLNPYRTTISNQWSGSQALYYTTQSMAAACLSEVSPNLASIGRQFQNHAVQCLVQESKSSKMDTSSLLAVVMLGMSRSWHDPADVGQTEFEMLARSVLSSDMGQGTESGAERQKQLFFCNSLVYWQMLLSFVYDQEPKTELKRHAQPQPARTHELELRRLCMPHPQTGIGIEVQTLVAEVGSLVRRERKRIRSRGFSSKNDIDEAKKAINRAEDLHCQLCKIQLPTENSIVDAEDDMTPGQHLLNVAEAYRCTGLLQLYRNFPDLLSPYLPIGEQEDAEANVSNESDVRVLRDAWLASLATHILDLIHDIPISSRSRSIHPLLLVSVCSDLSLGTTQCFPVGTMNAPVESIASSPRFNARVTDLDILRGRRFILSRLSSFENILAAKPIQTMISLVKETWSRMEATQDNVYWMDVMRASGFETLMG